MFLITSLSFFSFSLIWSVFLITSLIFFSFSRIWSVFLINFCFLLFFQSHLVGAIGSTGVPVSKIGGRTADVSEGGSVSQEIVQEWMNMGRIIYSKIVHTQSARVSIRGISFKGTSAWEVLYLRRLCRDG